jgi:hypothetical protein
MYPREVRIEARIFIFTYDEVGTASTAGKLLSEESTVTGRRTLVPTTGKLVKASAPVTTNFDRMKAPGQRVSPLLSILIKYSVGLE